MLLDVCEHVMHFSILIDNRNYQLHLASAKAVRHVEEGV